MELKELAKYNNIAIQCHDIPDADTICSGLALQCFLRSMGADALLCYGGMAEITKPNLLMLIDMLKIEITYLHELPPETDLLITVDCQRGAGNVQRFDLSEKARIVVIDHHRPEIPEGEDIIIRPHLASCATLVWSLLQKEGFEFDRRIQNALYYGLYTDTNGLSELRHPLDRDLSELQIDGGMIRKLKNAAITIEELDIIGAALKCHEVIDAIGLFRAEPCDANLLGFTSDISQQVVNLDCCVIYCAQKHGLKLSIRSSAREIMANEIADFICREAGSGGGNLEKAGGFMSFAKIAEKSSNSAPEDYLVSRVRAYIDNYELVYAGENDISFDAFPLYKKLPLPVGYAVSTDIFPDGTKITIRTLEGDIDTVAGKNIYLMIGIMGEIYPILKERFEKSYNALEESYTKVAEYQPIILNRFTGERKEVLPFAKTCIPQDDKLVRAKLLQKDTKVFSYWDMEKYFHGVKGDYLVANEDNHADCYIVRQDIFRESYERLEI